MNWAVVLIWRFYSSFLVIFVGFGDTGRISGNFLLVQRHESRSFQSRKSVEFLKQPMSERFESSCLNPTSLETNSFLGASSFRPEPHVAQRSRRDKLRVNPTSHIQEYSHNLLSLPRNLALNPVPIQPRNARNSVLLQDAAMFSSEMLGFPSNSHVLLSHKEPVLHQGSVVVDPPIDRQEVPKAGDPSNPIYWRALSSHQNSDWIVNYVNSSANNSCSQNPIFGGGNVSATPYLKPCYTGYHDTQSSLISPSSELTSQDSQKQYGEMTFSSPSFCQNALQEACTSSSMGTQGFPLASLVHQNIREAGRGPWVDGGNELVLLPSYGNQTNASQINNSSVWMNRPVEGSHQWNNEEDFAANTSGREFGTLSSDHKAQGLSLSLSSQPHPDLHVPQFEERFGSENLPPRIGDVHASQDSKIDNLGQFCSYSKSSIGSKVYGNSDQGIVSASTDARCGIGPLGPFTGYATILKSSKFLKPAQQLLDEFCSINRPKLVKTSEMSEKGSIDVPFARDTVNAENEVGGKSGNSGVSSTSFYSSTDACVDGAVGSGACQAYLPEFQRKKAKLLYMQEEVCRRYKQYHQQMQMVVSSFETVAGLSAATPYTSLALKAVSKHFRCLKNAISDQIKHISKVLGEEFMCYSSTSKGETTTPKLRFIDQSLRKQKSGESLGFLEQQQHVWRPQRGLPERAVAVLRAWLFEHFLHPYPTDTDKHMLATQTGLSRNQVSNWFINARVRVWKPMVEEIHMLETKGSSELHLTSNKDDGKHIADTEEGRSIDQMNRPGKDQPTDIQSDCSTVAPILAHMEGGQNPEVWHHEKRSRMDEGQIPASVDAGLIGFLPYHQGSLEIGGLGTVSLTLGLRNSNESAHQQHQQQFRRFFGDQMVHDFVG